MDNQIYTNTNTNTNIPKGYPMDTRQPSRDPIKQIVFTGSVQHTCLLDSSWRRKKLQISKSLGTFVFGKIQCMLHTKTAETRWSSGYSELMFRHILCHHHYWHRPGVIRARMLVTQWQFCMTSSNNAKTDKSAQIRESKFSLMTQWQFCMISGNATENNESASNSN